MARSHTGHVPGKKRSRAGRQETRTQTPEERKVFDALANPKWQLRSVSGLARETRLTEEMVRTVLKHNPDRVRVSSVPASNGDLLYAPKTRPESSGERLALFRIFLTKSIS